MKHQIVFLLLALGLLIIIPITSLFLTEKSNDVRSKAAEEKMIPVLPPLSPFIRVGVARTHTKKGELLPIYISAKSNDQAVVEAQIVLTYDPTQFILDEKNIRNETIFPVLSITKIEPGKVVFSVFVDTQSGYDPVLISEEKIIATLFLTTVGEKNDTAIKLVHEGDEKTQLYAVRDNDTGIAPDILSTTQDVNIHLD